MVSARSRRLMLGLLCFPAVSATPRVPHLDALAEGLERQTGTRQLQVVAEPEVGFLPSSSRSEELLERGSASGGQASTSGRQLQETVSERRRRQREERREREGTDSRGPPQSVILILLACATFFCLCTWHWRRVGNTESAGASCICVLLWLFPIGVYIYSNIDWDPMLVWLEGVWDAIGNAVLMLCGVCCLCACCAALLSEDEITVGMMVRLDGDDTEWTVAERNVLAHKWVDDSELNREFFVHLHQPAHYDGTGKFWSSADMWTTNRKLDQADLEEARDRANMQKKEKKMRDQRRAERAAAEPNYTVEFDIGSLFFFTVHEKKKKKKKKHKKDPEERRTQKKEMMVPPGMRVRLAGDSTVWTVAYYPSEYDRIELIRLRHESFPDVGDVWTTRGKLDDASVEQKKKMTRKKKKKKQQLASGMKLVSDDGSEWTVIDVQNGRANIEREDDTGQIHRQWTALDQLRRVKQFASGDRVTWTKSDDDIPIGLVGEVQGPAHDGRLRVEFNGRGFNIRPDELVLATTKESEETRGPSESFEVDVDQSSSDDDTHTANPVSNGGSAGSN